MKVVRSTDDKTTLLVFGSIEGNVKEFENKRHIGVNLDTGEVDSVVYAYEINISRDLNQIQLENLAKYLPALLILQKGVLAITAKARSGKDYLAAQVIDKFAAIHQALGAPIKEASAIIFGKPKKGKNREKLVKLGQTARKWIDSDIWIKAWLRIVLDEYFEKGAKYFVVPDVRQPNELQFFKSLGATIVKITADEEKRLAKIAELDGASDLNDELLKDETEMHVDTFTDVDITLFNNYDEQFKRDINVEVVGHLAESRGWELYD